MGELNYSQPSAGWTFSGLNAALIAGSPAGDSWSLTSSQEARRA